MSVKGSIEDLLPMAPSDRQDARVLAVVKAPRYARPPHLPGRERPAGRRTLPQLPGVPPAAACLHDASEGVPRAGVPPLADLMATPSSLGPGARGNAPGPHALVGQRRSTPRVCGESFGHWRGDTSCHCRPVAAAPPTERCSASCGAPHSWANSIRQPAVGLPSLLSPRATRSPLPDRSNGCANASRRSGGRRQRYGKRLRRGTRRRRLPPAPARHRHAQAALVEQTAVLRETKTRHAAAVERLQMLRARCDPPRVERVSDVHDIVTAALAAARSRGVMASAVCDCGRDVPYRPRTLIDRKLPTSSKQPRCVAISVCRVFGISKTGAERCLGRSARRMTNRLQEITR